MNKTVLTLALLAGVSSANMNALYAGDPQEERSKSLVSSIARGTFSKPEERFVVSAPSAKVKTAVLKNEPSEKVRTREEAINDLTHYSSVALAGVASVAYMIAQPTHAFAVLVPWVAYGLPKMVVSVAQMCEKAYNDRLKAFRKPVVEAVLKAGVPSKHQESIVQNLMGRSEAYRNQFVELFSDVKREGLSDYQNFSMAFAISTLREDRIGLVSGLLKCFDDNEDIHSWYNIVEDVANTIRHRSPKGVCVDNEGAVNFVRRIAEAKTN